MYQLRYTIPTELEWEEPILNLTITNIEISKPEPTTSWYTDNGWSGLFADELYLELNKLWQQQNYNNITLKFNGASSANSYRYQISYDGNWNTATWITVNSNTASPTLEAVTSGQTKSFKVRVQAYSASNLGGVSGAIYEDQNNIIYGPTAAAKVNQAPKQYQDSFITSSLNKPSAPADVKEYVDSFSTSILKSTYTPSKTNNSVTNKSTEYIDNYVVSAQNRSFQPSSLPGKAESGFLVVTNTSTDPNTYAIAHKKMLSMGIDNPYTGGKWQYYTFGTSLYMPFSIEEKEHSSGFGFFVKDSGYTGYFIKISTVPFAVSAGSKRVVAIYKVKGKNIKRLQDTQTMFDDAMVFVQAAKPYEVNVKVKYDIVGGVGTKTTITAFINGYEISAIDDDDPLEPTQELALVSFKGKAFFDYVYAYAITQQKYDESDTFNMYAGSNLSMSLKTFFGDSLIGNPNMLEQATSEEEWGYSGAIEDFGSVAREIKKIKVAFEDAPGEPSYASIGVNTNVTILSEKYNNFNAEIYILNNTGFNTPLADSENTFAIIGNKIQKAGTIRYQDKEQNEYSKNEPVVFETSWIQEEKDIINLSTWLKNYWAKNNSTISMEIFGNPLLMVGDVITVTYDRVDLSSSQKFVIISVEQDFNGGLTTTLTCSSI